MKLDELLVDTKLAWIEFPGCEGFEVEVANLSRKELVNLRKRCITTKFDRKTRLAEEILDDEKFVTEFTKATIKNWRGLKLKYLEDLILVELGDNDPEIELEYNFDNAHSLVSNSTEFDSWINEVVFDLANFRGGTEGASVGSDRKVAKKQRSQNDEGSVSGDDGATG